MLTIIDCNGRIATFHVCPNIKFAVVLSLLILCFMYLTLFVGVCVGLCVLSSFAIILTMKKELVRCFNYLDVFRSVVFCGSTSRCSWLACSV